MKRKIILIVCLANLIIISLTAYGQSSFTLSVPVIYSKVEVPNNWSPPTAINRENKFNGTALGYGVNLNYSFSPTILIKNQHILMNIGIGYFKQRFDLLRPFDYDAPIQPGFYTDHYSYHCLQGIFGMSYNYSLKKNYFLSGNLSYSWLRSFRQEYTPLYSYIAGTNYYGKVSSHQKINFGNLLMLSIGVNKHLGSKFSLGLNILAPLYTRWRNDKIFKDDPTTFFHPEFSLGFNVSIAYRLQKKHNP